jgi:hypothetical protein
MHDTENEPQEAPPWHSDEGAALRYFYRAQVMLRSSPSAQGRMLERIRELGHLPQDKHHFSTGPAMDDMRCWYLTLRLAYVPLETWTKQVLYDSHNNIGDTNRLAKRWRCGHDQVDRYIEDALVLWRIALDERGLLG